MQLEGQSPNQEDTDLFTIGVCSHACICNLPLEASLGRSRDLQAWLPDVLVAGGKTRLASSSVLGIQYRLAGIGRRYCFLDVSHFHSDDSVCARCEQKEKCARWAFGIFRIALTVYR